MDEHLDIKVTAKVLKNPREMLWLTEDMHNVRYRATGEWTNLVGARFEAVDFSGSVFDPFNAQASIFLGCDFTKVKMKSGSLGILQGHVPSVYRDCTFERADLRGAGPDNARFERCLFRDTRIDGWGAIEAEFVDCTFEGRLTDVRFSGATSFPNFKSVDIGRSRNEFRGNDLSTAELVRVEFILGVDLSVNRLPEGPEYIHVDRLPERIARARADVARWPDDKAREKALLWLRTFSEGGYVGQPSLFWRRVDIAPKQPDVGARLLELLEAPM